MNTIKKTEKKHMSFDLKKHKDNTLHSLFEVEKFLNCDKKKKNYAYLFKLFK